VSSARMAGSVVFTFPENVISRPLALGIPLL